MSKASPKGRQWPRRACSISALGLRLTKRFRGWSGENADPRRPGRLLPVIGSRLGGRAPSVTQAIEAIAAQRGEVIVPNGAAAANALGLTTQVPVRSVYLTSGRSRILTLGNQ